MLRNTAQSFMHTYTICPPAPQTIFYDEFSHAWKYHHAYASTRATGIAYTDFKRGMSFHRATTHRCSKYIPAFAYDDKQLAKALTLAAWRYVHGGNKPIPTNLTLDELIQITDRKFKVCLKHDVSHMPDRQQECILRHQWTFNGPGAYMRKHAALVYLSWRQGLYSTEVAEQLGMTPQQVRVNLCRLRAIAHHLGFDAGAKRDWGGHASKLPRPRTLIQMVKDFGVHFVAAEFGLAVNTVYHAFVRAKSKRATQVRAARP